MKQLASRPQHNWPLIDEHGRSTVALNAFFDELVHVVGTINSQIEQLKSRIEALEQQ